MKKPARQQQVLVYRNGKLCWRIRNVYEETIRKPWYKGGAIIGTNITYGESRYIEILEENTNG